MRNVPERSLDDAADDSCEPFRELLDTLLRGVASQWRVTADENWCHAEPVAGPPATARVQGWKLHVSSTVADAERVLGAALPVLVAARCAFKFARTPQVLSRMNDAHAAREGSGKFLTVYPAADADLPELASSLDSATEGLDGPAILSDARYRPMSLVHLRYGAFSGVPLLSADGELLAGIRDPAGRVVPDRREPRFTPPPWARYPLPSPPAPPPSGQVLLDGRFLVRRAIRHASKGGVFVAEDRASGGEVIVKQARRHVGGGTRGGDAGALLRREESALRALARHGRTPRPLGLFEQGGDLFLAQEYLPGVTLRRWLADHRTDLGPTVGGPALAGLAAGIAGLVALVHADGLVLRDLSPNNILVSGPGQVRMVDLEHAIGVPVTGHDGGRGAGTIGYMAPEQAAGADPHPSADVYALGALACFLFTGEDPLPATGFPPGGDYPSGLIADWLAAPGRRLLVPAGARALIEACTAPDPRARPDAATAAKALHGLRPGRPPAPRQVVAAALTGLAPHPADLPGVVRDLATAVTAELRPAPAAPTDAFGRLFASAPPGSLSDPRNVQHGAAGACGILAEMYRRTADPRLGEATAAAAQWLLARTGPPQGPVGLYFGGSGPAWALAAAGRALDRPEFLAAAAETALAQDPHWPSPDLTHGRAGLGLTLWELWRHTGDERLPARAATIADSLIADAERGADGTVSWHAPASGGSRLADKRFYGLAHGIAGIGLFLLETATQTGRQDCAELAAAAVDTLLARATTAAGTLNWASDPGNPSTEAAYWCNGAGGVATFLARAYTRTGDRRLPPVLDGAAKTMMTRKWRLGLAYCHGLAGNGDTLLETAEVLGSPRHAAWAADLGAMTVAAVRRDGPGSAAGPGPAGPGVRMTADFQVGLGGVLAFLARLDTPGPRLWLPPLYPDPRTPPGPGPLASRAVHPQPTRPGKEVNP
jgi:serine/threonine protein kinase